MLKILCSAYTQYTQNNLTSLITGPIKNIFYQTLIVKHTYLPNYKKKYLIQNRSPKNPHACVPLSVHGDFKNGFILHEVVSNMPKALQRAWRQV